MVCELVPSGRGPAPAEPLVPSGPHVEENYGKAAPAPTYEDLLKTAYDDTLFDYYFTSQLRRSMSRPARRRRSASRRC